MNIYQRLSAVRERLSYIKKDSTVTGYKAISHDAVTAEIRPILIELGVLIIPRLVKSHISDAGATSSNKPIIRYEAWYEIDFINIEKPEDKATISIEAHANDHGDKAPGKAISYATKYAILKIFNIETGENDESRYEAKPKAYAPDDKKHFLRFIETDDQLGFYLFGRLFLDMDNQNLEGWTSLNSDYLATAPKGCKGKEKARLTEIEETGKKLHENIIKAIETEDSSLFNENIEGAGKFTKQMLWNTFTSEEQATAKSIIETS